MADSKEKHRKRTRLAKRGIFLKCNQVIWSFRALPSVIIIGAQKSGTTSLFNYMAQHPQLLPSKRKEVHYFDGGNRVGKNSFARGEYWYRSNFPFKFSIRDNQKAFEASPLYLLNPVAPQRIFELIPDVKLIVILRNPVERAISHYFHNERRGLEPLPIFDALISEEERLKAVVESGDYNSASFIHHTYLSRGRYCEQLKRFDNYFPRENRLVLNSENLFLQPQETLRRVFKFAGVAQEFTISDLTPRNVGANKAKVDLQTYQYLENYFQPHNQALYEYLGQDYGW